MRNRPTLVDDLQRAGGPGVQVHVTRDLVHLGEVCERAAQQGITRVGCVGGDGTASAVATALTRAYGPRPVPTLALLRGGTMNTVANCMGVPARSPRVLLARWLRRPERTTERTPLRVGDSLGFLFGVGLFPNWLQAYYEAGHGRPSSRTAARVVVHTALSSMYGGRLSRRVIAPIEAVIETDGEPWPSASYFCVMAGAVDEVGLSFRVFQHATDQRGHVDLIALRSPGWKLALAMPDMFVRRAGLPRDITDERLVRRAVLRSTNGPLLYSLDGDLHRSEVPLTVTRGPSLPIADLS